MAKQATVKNLTLADDRVTAVVTDHGILPCNKVVLAAGKWSKPLADKLGLRVPMETARGYHIDCKNPSAQLRNPVMVAAWKFVATPMEDNVHCAADR